VLLAGDASGGGSGTLSLLLMMGLIFGAMYFLMIRPQQRRRREAESMQSGLGVGDEVVTIGGLYGTVTGMDDEAVHLEIAPGVEARYARGAISRIVTKASSADETAEDADDRVETD
jgi:preprotein translocase subunit YajC